MKAIITYHSIDASGSPVSITEAVFRRHVEWLAARGPRAVTVDELLGLPSHESAVALTFDDAFVNFATVAWPLLRDHCLPVTLFVPTGHVGGTNEWGGARERDIPVLPLLGWDELGRLAADGVTLGSHTCTHPHLDRLDARSVREELETSSEQIAARTGTRPAGLAYPYGSHDRSVAHAAAATYDFACTTDLRLLDTTNDRHMLPRLDAYYLQGAGILESWGTPLLRMYVSARAGARRCRELVASAGRT